MSMLTILLFFVYTYGLGFNVNFFIKKEENFFERTLITTGIGLCFFVFLSVLFGIIGIPLDWRLFIFISLIGPIIYVILHYKKFNMPQLKLKKSDIYVILVLIMAFITLVVYNKGSFSYPWLEDDDSWHHATGVKYIATEKSIKGNPPLAYVDPYPPGYDILIGILYQTSTSLQWTLKYFNNLIIALSIVFFYFFALRFTGKKEVALFSTFILFSFPSYLSHFIWAHSLVMTIFIVSLYCIEMIRKDRNWIFVNVVVVASAWLVSPTKPIKFFILYFVYIFVKCVIEKKIKWDLIFAVAGGYILAFIWWFNHLEIHPIMAKTTIGEAGLGGGNIFLRIISFIQKVFPPTSGSATRAYSFNEIIFAQHQNMINNPIGIGIVISILIALGAISIILSFKDMKKEENSWKLIVLIWTVLTFLGFNTMTFNLPIGFFSFRVWMIFALFASIMVAEGLWFLFGIINIKIEKFILVACCMEVILIWYKNRAEYLNSLQPPHYSFMTINWFWTLMLIPIIIGSCILFYYIISSLLNIKFNVFKASTLLIFIILVFIFSAIPKYSVNTAIWPFGIGWKSMEEVQLFSWLKENTEPNTKVYTLRDNFMLLGFDMYSCVWCKDFIEFSEDNMNKTPEEIYKWLKINGYSYFAFSTKDRFAIDGYDYQNNIFLGNNSIKKMQEIAQSGYFVPIKQNNGGVIFQLK